MPTVILIRGWRLFFYSDEGSEPVHIHAEKGGAEAKIWLDAEAFGIEFAYEYDLTPALRRELRKIVFGHFDDIVSAWEEHFGEQS
jgi:hypothetical protein